MYSFAAYDRTLDAMHGEDIPNGTKPMPEEQIDRQNESGEFSKFAAEQDPGLIAEFWDFLVHNKKWWLTPIILVLLLIGVLVVLSGTAAAPFIYTLW
jgi:Family of unknown function (DUF5989)